MVRRSPLAYSADEARLLDAFPLRAIDHDTKDFYAAWLIRRFLLNQCADCAHWHHPPKPICPRCWSTDLLPAEASGKGTVHLLVWLHERLATPGLDNVVGNLLATIALAEATSLRFTSTLINCSPEDLRIGLPVELVWVERYGVPFPAFQPAGLVEAVEHSLALQ